MITIIFFVSNSRCKIASKFVSGKCLDGVGICLYVAKRKTIVVSMDHYVWDNSNALQNNKIL